MSRFFLPAGLMQNKLTLMSPIFVFPGHCFKEIFYMSHFSHIVGLFLWLFLHMSYFSFTVGLFIGLFLHMSCFSFTSGLFL